MKTETKFLLLKVLWGVVILSGVVYMVFTTSSDPEGPDVTETEEEPIVNEGGDCDAGVVVCDDQRYPTTPDNDSESETTTDRE